MKKAPRFVVAVVLGMLSAIGCNDPTARELAQQRAELEATKAELARVRAEAQASRDELIQALADAQMARNELARMRNEPVPPPPSRKTEPDAAPLDQRLASLKANYDR